MLVLSVTPHAAEAAQRGYAMLALQEQPNQLTGLHASVIAELGVLTDSMLHVHHAIRVV